MVALFVVTTNREDRSRDVVNTQGIDTSWHERNPIVLLEHGECHGQPIGKCEDGEGRYQVRLFSDYATARVHFSQSCPVAAQVFRLVDEGILRGASIGFRPLKVRKRHLYDDDGYHDPRASGLLVENCELLEVSVCSLPDNPEAVLVATELASRGRIGAEPLTEPIRKSLARLTRWRKSLWRTRTDRRVRDYIARQATTRARLAVAQVRDLLA